MNEPTTTQHITALKKRNVVLDIETTGLDPEKNIK